MGSTMVEDFNMELKNFALQRTIAGYLNESVNMSEINGRIDKLEETVRCLEEESRKIDAFKRELPLCVQLITDVIEMLREELEKCRETNTEAKELKSNDDEKKNWSSSLKLWSGSSCEEKMDEKKDTEKLTDHSSLESKSMMGGGAFVLFKVSVSASNADYNSIVVPELSLVSPAIGGVNGKSVVDEEHLVVGGGNAELDPVSVSAGGHSGLLVQQQGPRKARRCWSPELHRRFVVALQQLGGAQVATPKQIRELMKIDGLTNDEVKSHLQKYRLHTRRAPDNCASAPHPMTMMEGLWVPPEKHRSSTSQQSGLQSGSPQSPLQLSGSSRGISGTAGDSGEDEM